MRVGIKQIERKIEWPRQQESNLYQELRKLLFYPLNYGEGGYILREKLQNKVLNVAKK